MNDSFVTTDTQHQPPAVIGQALLFSPEIENEVKAEEARGRYTLERFRQLRPEAHADVIRLLAAAKPGYEGLRRIANIVGVHHLTVAAVRDDEESSRTIDTLRERISKKCLTAVEMLVDRLLESPGSIPAGMIGMAIDQLTKNAELLGNRPTAREEKGERINIYHHWDEVLEKMLEPGDVREVPSEIGLVGEKKLAIGAPSSSDQPGTAAPASDAQSRVSRTDPEARPPADTASDTDRGSAEAAIAGAAAPPDARNGAGGGSRPVRGGAQSRSGSGEQNFCDNASSDSSA